MLCADCTEQTSDGTQCCTYYAAARRASIIRKAGGLIFSTPLVLSLIAFTAGSIQWAAIATLLVPIAAVLYGISVIRWLRASKQPY